MRGGCFGGTHRAGPALRALPLDHVTTVRRSAVISRTRGRGDGPRPYARGAISLLRGQRALGRLSVRSHRVTEVPQSHRGQGCGETAGFNSHFSLNSAKGYFSNAEIEKRLFSVSL